MIRPRFIMSAVYVVMVATITAMTTKPVWSDEITKTTLSGPKPTVAVMQAPDNGPAAPNTLQAIQQRLANVGFSVVDNTNRKLLLSEQAAASDGQVTPATQTRLGRMLGVNFLAIFRLTYSVTNEQRTGLLSILNNTPSYVTKVALSNKLQFVDVKSGAIVQSVEDSRDITSPVHQGTQAQGFYEDAFPKLRDASVDALAAKIDRALFVSSGNTTTITGKILDVTGSSVTLSLGTSSGVSVGQILDFFDSKTILNPDTNKTIVTMVKRGSLQVTQVEPEYCIGALLPTSAKPVKLQLVRLSTQ